MNLKHLKTSLGMDILRSKTPEMVRKEIYAHFLARVAFPVIRKRSFPEG